MCGRWGMFLFCCQAMFLKSKMNSDILFHVFARKNIVVHLWLMQGLVKSWLGYFCIANWARMNHKKAWEMIFLY